MLTEQKVLTQQELIQQLEQWRTNANAAINKTMYCNTCIPCTIKKQKQTCTLRQHNVATLIIAHITDQAIQDIASRYNNVTIHQPCTRNQPQADQQAIEATSQPQTTIANIPTEITTTTTTTTTINHIPITPPPNTFKNDDMHTSPTTSPRSQAMTPPPLDHNTDADLDWWNKRWEADSDDHLHYRSPTPTRALQYEPSTSPGLPTPSTITAPQDDPDPIHNTRDHPTNYDELAEQQLLADIEYEESIQHEIYTQQRIAQEQFESAQQFWQHRLIDTDDEILSTESTDINAIPTAIQTTDTTQQHKKQDNNHEHNNTYNLTTYDFFVALQNKTTTPMHIINNNFLQSHKSLQHIRELNRLFYHTTPPTEQFFFMQYQQAQRTNDQAIIITAKWLETEKQYNCNYCEQHKPHQQQPGQFLQRCLTCRLFTCIACAANTSNFTCNQCDFMHRYNTKTNKRHEISHKPLCAICFLHFSTFTCSQCNMPLCCMCFHQITNKKLCDICHKNTHM